jgi:hypothetical protein
VHAIGERTREQPPTEVRRSHWWLWALGTVLGGAVLMFCYLRVAGTTELNSDAAGIVLQASDMLHGNLLLHGWWDTDVSFITTELPEYMAVTKVAGIRPEVVHICAALTYTLLVLLAAFVARGRARDPEGVVRALLAATVMLAPQPSGPTPVLLGSPDHVGTAVPLLLLLLLLDRTPPPQARLRWYLPAAVGTCVVTTALLAWVIVGDPLAEVAGVVPLVLACLLRVIRIVVVRAVRAVQGRRAARAGARGPAGDRDGIATAGRDAPVAADSAVAGLDRANRAAADTSWRAVGYHLLLAAAAGAAVPLARMASTWISQHGGYQLGPNRYGLLPWSTIVKNAPLIWQSILALFGADYSGVRGEGNIVFALVHFAGLAVVVAAVAFAIWRLIVPARGARAGDLVADFLVLAIGVNIVAYLAFIRPVNIYDAHEIGPVVSFGAALAGRMLGGPLLRVRRVRREPGQEALPRPAARRPWLAARLPRRPRTNPDGSRPGTPVLVPVLAAGLACYAVLLGIAAATPQSPPQNVQLAAWLTQHHLRSGLASYWESSSVTVDSSGKLTMLAIGIHGWNRRLAPDQWETDVRLDNPATHTANFVVAGPDRIVPVALEIKQFGKPAHTYRYGPYTIMVWNKNLLGELNPI